MARLPTERRGVHVGHALVGCQSENHDVHDSGESDKEDAVAHHWRIQIDGRINGRQLLCLLQLTAPQDDSNRNQEQAEHKDPGKDQEKQNPDVGVGRAGQHEVVHPETDEGDGAAGGQNHAGQAQRVLAEVEEQPRPIFESALRTHTPCTSFPRAIFPSCTLREKPQRRIRQGPSGITSLEPAEAGATAKYLTTSGLPDKKRDPSHLPPPCSSGWRTLALDRGRLHGRFAGSVRAMATSALCLEGFFAVGSILSASNGACQTERCHQCDSRKNFLHHFLLCLFLCTKRPSRKIPAVARTSDMFPQKRQPQHQRSNLLLINLLVLLLPGIKSTGPQSLAHLLPY